MRCSSKGTLCKTCIHNLAGGRCSKSYWTDMIGIARGIKPTKSHYRRKLKTVKRKKK